jgi:hypothetical protein
LVSEKINADFMEQYQDIVRGKTQEEIQSIGPQSIISTLPNTIEEGSNLLVIQKIVQAPFQVILQIIPRLIKIV